MRRIAADAVTGPITHHGEGPVWHPDFAGLRLVDMFAGDLLELGAGEPTRWHLSTVAAAFRPRAGGGVLFAGEREFLLLDADSVVVGRVDDVIADPAVRFNDGGCDADGGFWCGSMGTAGQPDAGALYRLAPDLTVEVRQTGFTQCNGFDLSPDHRVAYHVDTPTRRLDVFDLPDRGGATRRALTSTGVDGVPDGITVDAEGGIWVAMWQGSAVHRYLPSGELDVVVDLPVSLVTACTFGGPDLTTLFITTSRLDFDDDDIAREPLAGAVFAVDAVVRGMPVLEFAG